MASPFENQWNRQPAPKTLSQLEDEKRRTWNPLKRIGLAEQIKMAQDQEALLAEAKRLKIPTLETETLPARGPMPLEEFLEIDLTHNLVNRSREEWEKIKDQAEQYRELAKEPGQHAALDAIIEQANIFMGGKSVTPLQTLKKRINFAKTEEPTLKLVTKTPVPSGKKLAAGEVVKAAQPAPNLEIEKKNARIMAITELDKLIMKEFPNKIVSPAVREACILEIMEELLEKKGIKI